MAMPHVKVAREACALATAAERALLRSDCPHLLIGSLGGRHRAASYAELESGMATTHAEAETARGKEGEQ